MRRNLSPLPWASSYEQGIRATIAEGDAVELFSKAHNAWVPGLVEELAKTSSGTYAVKIAAPSVSTTSIAVHSDDCIACIKKACRVSLVAPGGGVEGNGAVYAELEDGGHFHVDVVGRKSTLYDRYPECWQGGGPAPNLVSFADDLLHIGVHESTDCFVFGSRGGQVVLPAFWRTLGNSMPPCVVINGGCAMNLPGPPVSWPSNATTIMLMAGQDFFRGSQPSHEYLQSACQCVSPENRTTAILYVPEMKHMPQPDILRAALVHLVRAALFWHVNHDSVPISHLRAAGFALRQLGCGSRLLYTSTQGQWQEMLFGPQANDRPAAPLSPRAPRPQQPPPLNPLGTAVAALPIAVALNMTPDKHRALAAQAKREAVQLLHSHSPKNARTLEMHQRLLEFAAGQDGEAYAAEGDLAREQARKAYQEKTPLLPKRTQQPRVRPHLPFGNKQYRHPAGSPVAQVRYPSDAIPVRPKSAHAIPQAQFSYGSLTQQVLFSANTQEFYYPVVSELVV